jgi:hypothetical protein
MPGQSEIGIGGHLEAGLVGDSLKFGVYGKSMGSYGIRSDDLYIVIPQGGRIDTETVRTGIQHSIKSTGPVAVCYEPQRIFIWTIRFFHGTGTW